MIKPFIFLFNTISVFLFSFFFGDSPVTLTGNFPKNAAAGTEFSAEITIDKSNISGFAKLQLEVPNGFTVKDGDSKSGDFTFSDNVAKIIWTSIPSDEKMTVKFLITADASAQGLKTIGAKFSFINSNVKEMAEMTPVEITIGDASTVAKTDDSDNTETTPTPVTTEIAPVTTTEPVATSNPSDISNPTEPSANVTCSRTITKTGTPNEYRIEVKIKKMEIEGFAKYQEVLPEGFTAKGDKTNGSSFSVSDGKAKFVWVTLPEEEEMTISYLLQKETGEDKDVKLVGEFSYLENDQTKKAKLPLDIISASGEFIAGVMPPPSTARTSSETGDNNTNANGDNNTATNNNNNNTTTSDGGKDPVVNSNNTLAVKEGNVAYVVQVGAFRNAIQSDVLSRKFNIRETIKSEMAEGYSKFMVGNFSEYKLARNHREEIKQKGCNSAFVAAYNGPKRITVQEALMITSQKWYK